jgi:hypothetical protein
VFVPDLVDDDVVRVPLIDDVRDTGQGNMRQSVERGFYAPGIKSELPGGFDETENSGAALVRAGVLADPRNRNIHLKVTEDGGKTGRPAIRCGLLPDASVSFEHLFSLQPFRAG